MTEQTDEKQVGIEEIRCAARWWKDAMRMPKHDNNDDSFAGYFANTLLGRLQADISEEQLDRFEEILIGKLSDPDYDGVFRGRWGMLHIGTDYHPEKVLRESAEEVGIKVNTATFPIKTMMWLQPGYVKVGRGHGVRMVEIFNDIPERCFECKHADAYNGYDGSGDGLKSWCSCMYQEEDKRVDLAGLDFLHTIPDNCPLKKGEEQCTD